MNPFDAAHKNLYYPPDRRFRIWIRFSILIGIAVAGLLAVAAAWIEVAVSALPYLSPVPQAYPNNFAGPHGFPARLNERQNMIKLRRVYESRGNDDGETFLVERLWPRGVKKTALADAIWVKDVAPSTELRKWFSHDPKKWVEFQHRYEAEIKEHEVALEPILQAARRGSVTLLYSSHDTEHNNAVVLRDYLERKRGDSRIKA